METTEGLRPHKAEDCQANSGKDATNHDSHKPGSCSYIFLLFIKFVHLGPCSVTTNESVCLTLVDFNALDLIFEGNILK